MYFCINQTLVSSIKAINRDTVTMLYERSATVSPLPVKLLNFQRVQFPSRYNSAKRTNVPKSCTHGYSKIPPMVHTRYIVETRWKRTSIEHPRVEKGLKLVFVHRKSNREENLMRKKNTKKKKEEKEEGDTIRVTNGAWNETRKRIVDSGLCHEATLCKFM